jgi:hypothetical protein
MTVAEHLATAILITERKLKVKENTRSFVKKTGDVIIKGVVWIGSQATQVPVKQAVVLLLAARSARPWATLTLQAAWDKIGINVLQLLVEKTRALLKQSAHDLKGKAMSTITTLLLTATEAIMKKKSALSAKMDEAVDAIIQRARPKCKALLRTRSFYNTVDMILQFKTHILGILESNVGGIYHATSTVLAPLDRIATRFVHELNLEVDFAFLHFNLAPLSLRRDIAMLGFLHKTNLPRGHPHIQDFFPSRSAMKI